MEPYQHGWQCMDTVMQQNMHCGGSMPLQHITILVRQVNFAALMEHASFSIIIVMGQWTVWMGLMKLDAILHAIIMMLSSAITIVIYPIDDSGTCP